ncbi:MAG: chemotaxis protein CheW [Magnetovibrio sp.]|nr:chemotaxis protein CheW [Magnetovibrio sp.]
MTGQALVASGSTDVDLAGGENGSEFVTFNIAGQLFGIPVLIVQDILVPENIASIPLAPPEVRGSINLRGRIVTVVDVRVRLGLERREIHVETVEEEAPQIETGVEAEEAVEVEASSAKAEEDDSAHAAVEAVKRKKRDHMMGVTVEHQNELYTLLVDSVGDVINLLKDSYEGNPSTLDPVWRDFASGVYRLDNNLMVVLDVERLLDFKADKP